MTLTRRAPLALLLLAVLLALVGSADAAPTRPEALDAAVHATGSALAPGDAVPFSGTVPGAGLSAVKLQVVDPDGRVEGVYGPFAVTAGAVSGTLPASATAGAAPTARTDYRQVLGLYAVPVGTPADAAAAHGAAAGSLAVSAPPSEPVLESSFVSSVGWVKPGEAYPFTVRVKNFQPAAQAGGTVTIPAVDGTTFTRVSDPAATIAGNGSITWAVGSVPANGAKRLVVDAKADSLAEDPQIVWKNLSATATRTGGGSATSRGPKVIPQRETYDTARYGDRPFPVVPVDYYQRRHGADSSADKLAKKINDPANPGSTFNLYQEMSYGQLFPNGTVPSDGIATANWAYGPGFAFTHTTPGQTCQSPTLNDLPNVGATPGYQALQPERIRDGWYQMPAPTEYYGADANGSALIGALSGVGSLQQIDGGCGPTAKAVFDAATIADPEIDYNDFDTDKDGVVDFFMMVYAGLGGNGDSQLSGTPPYDNIWPHSSSLEGSYTDPTTGQKGYVSDDQLTDLEGRKLYWTDDSYSAKTTTDTGLPAHVAVGPYNVNPESAIAKASVISHEYGHSLGLPDFYSTGSRGTYGTWNLMAEDHSQNMDVFSRQELGWLVPRVLEPGKKVDATNIRDSKVNTHRIDWKDKDGNPYALTGPSVANGEAYVAKLPSRQIIDPARVPSGSHVWWSKAGNDFGCAPLKGHNLDIALPQLKQVPAGTPVTVSFKSSFDIEWDFDYGFVLGTTDGGKSYASFPSQNGYTTPSSNPNGSDCQGQYGNGLTGNTQSYEDGTEQVDRVLGNYPGAPFVDDTYDISSLAGKASALRFTYATDPGFARPGWFIDDIVVKAGDRVIYSSDFERAQDESIYNGGCREGLATSTTCTDGWQYVSAFDGSPADHAYYLEMRDRASFDLDGRGEDDRGAGPDWQPGLSLVYTDENHGYGNVGTDDPPAQSPLDSKPDDATADSAVPDLSDAAFKPADGRGTFSDFGAGRVDNYSNPAEPDGRWRFAYDCLRFNVSRMTGDANGVAAGTPAGVGDITGDVTFDTGARASGGGKGCGTFDYGYEGTSADPGGTLVPGVDATPKGRSSAAGGGRGGASGGGRGSGTLGGGVTGGSCVVPTGFKSASVRPSGSGLRFAAVPSVAGRFTVDIFRQSIGSRVIGERRVAHYTDRRGAFTFTGRGARGNGYYLVRYGIRTKDGTDFRRIVVRRSGGRYSVRRAYEQRPRCGLLRQAKLERPVFGGTGRRSLGAAYRVGGDAQVSIAVLRGSRVVKRLKTTSAKAGRAYRVRFTAKGLRRGEYRVVIAAKRGSTVERATLTSRRL